MQSRVSFFVLLIFLSLIARAQDPVHPKGAEKIAFGITDAMLADQWIQTIAGIGGSSVETLKEQSLKPYLLPVRKIEIPQAEKSYLLAACLEYYVNLNKNYKINLSPEYILLNLSRQAAALTWEDAFKFLAEEGTINAAVIPYGSTTLTNAVYATPRFRIHNYVHLFRPVTRPGERLFEIRKAILRGHPVLMDMQLDDAFRQAYNVRSWNPEQAPQSVFPLMVVGYDESRQAFEVASPWGSEWGKGGYLWLSYDLVSKQAVNGFVLVPEGNL